MNKIYGIRFYQGSLVVRNGKLAVYATKELAEKDLRNMPDSWTDYDHFEVVEIDLLSSADELLFAVLQE
jgi:hypothetical protein